MLNQPQKAKTFTTEDTENTERNKTKEANGSCLSSVNSVFSVVNCFFDSRRARRVAVVKRFLDETK